MKIFSADKPKRKGQVGDIAFVVITIASICITLILARYVFVKVDEGIKQTGMNTTASNKVFTDMEVMFPMLDNMMLFIVIGLTIGLLFSSFLLPTHPIFLVVNIVGMIILLFCSMIMANLYHDIQMDPSINEVLVNQTAPHIFDKTNFIMLKLPWICFFISLISTIVMYAKGREGI